MHKIIETQYGNTVHIVGNGHYRDIVYGWELTDDEREWYAGLLDDETIDNGQFFHYHHDV